MGITSSTGIGSGIDIQKLATQLAKAEAQPALNAISRQKSGANTRLSGLGTLKSAVSDFQSAVSKLKDGSLFKTHKASSSEESILKVTAETGSVAGSYAVKVNQLAKAQKSVAKGEFSSQSDPIGSGGSLTFATASGSSFNLTVGDSTTLAGLAEAINGASGNNFLKATVVNVDHVSSGPDDPENGKTVSRLVLTSLNTGTANAFTVSGSDNDNDNADSFGLSGFFSDNLQAQVSAADAIIEVDGQTATRSSNRITDVLTGVSLDLLKASEGATVNVDVSLDSEAISGAINGFVTAYNKLSSTTQSLGKYGGSTDGSGDGNGPLIGNSTLRYISSQVRQNITGTVSSASSKYNSLAMVGVTIKDGTMTLDSSKLNAALNADLQSVSDVFTSSNGVATRTYDRLSFFLQSGGPLDSQQNSLKKQITTLDDRKSDIEERQAKSEAMFLKQFTAMDVTVGKFNNTGNFLNNWIQNS